MAVRLPVTVRAYLAADRVLATATHLHYLFWDEVLWAWTHSGQREAANEIIFGNSSTYLPGGNAFEEGLFGWEQTAIATPPFPQTGRILLGGAGGGRELNQLCMRGFDVVAFEPSARLFEGATQVVSKYPNSTIIRASYGDLVAAARELSGPLAHAVLNTSFDAVVFGWESLSYVLSEPDRLSLLRATHAIAPKAPVLLSFADLESDETGRLDRVRPALRRVFKLLGAPSSRRQGEYFRPHNGFSRGLTADEIAALADSSGYRVVHLDRGWGSYPHALLAPQ